MLARPPTNGSSFLLLSPHPALSLEHLRLFRLHTVQRGLPSAPPQPPGQRSSRIALQRTRVPETLARSTPAPVGRGEGAGPLGLQGCTLMVEKGQCAEEETQATGERHRRVTTGVSATGVSATGVLRGPAGPE